MRRIHFLVPDLPMAKRIVDELLLARIEERVRTHLPRVEIGGTEPRIPPFPWIHRPDAGAAMKVCAGAQAQRIEVEERHSMI